MNNKNTTISNRINQFLEWFLIINKYNIIVFITSLVTFLIMLFNLMFVKFIFVLIVISINISGIYLFLLSRKFYLILFNNHILIRFFITISIVNLIFFSMYNIYSLYINKIYLANISTSFSTTYGHLMFFYVLKYIKINTKTMLVIYFLLFMIILTILNKIFIISFQDIIIKNIKNLGICEASLLHQF